MGCGASKEQGLQTVDDSVHVMLKHDKKVAQKKGQAPKGYVPRAPHPLLQPKEGGEGGGGGPANGGGGGEKDGEAAPPAERKRIVASEED